MNRDELQSKLIQEMIEDMDLKTIMNVLYDFMDSSYSNYSDKDLLKEVDEYYPELLIDIDTTIEGENHDE